jgi:hypothetical protein
MSVSGKRYLLISDLKVIFSENPIFIDNRKEEIKI